MKKIIISAFLLGAVSLGSMAFIQQGSDEPPVRRTEARHGHHDCREYRDDCPRYQRRGGCCGQQQRRECRRNQECCSADYDCGACRYDHCTVDGCHENGRLCEQCAEWNDRHRRDDMYRRR